VALAPNVSKESSVDERVEGLDPSVEHLWKAGDLADVADLETGIAEGGGGSAGTREIITLGGQSAREFDDAGLIGDRKKG
jgi:hypothetical protein